jgi:eukaryotic-like serine/threonine-protein kinase
VPAPKRAGTAPARALSERSFAFRPFARVGREQHFARDASLGPMGSPYAPGDVIAERYRVERVVGEGGMGVVLAAEHLVLGERVAVKLLLPEAAKNADAVARFQREARAAARIPSEHVARVMDVGRLEDGTPYLVMEYVDGRDLGAELDERGPLPIAEAVGYVLQAAIGVSEAHAIGIVHRDLKPSNLCLARLPGDRILVKVLDFGIAKITDDNDSRKLTKSFSALGSIAYMSPEQLRAAKDVDARADVWAFGVVLFELLTARMPFNGESLTAISASITADQPYTLRSFRPDAPAELEGVVASCLEKDRERRMPSLAALARALEPFGGRSASSLVARIVDAHPGRQMFESLTSDSGISALPVSGGTPAVTIADAAATRGSWTTSEIDEPPTLRQRSHKKPILLAAAVLGIALLGIAIGFAWPKRQVESSPAASSDAVPVAESAPTVSASASEEPSASSDDVEPEPSAEPPSPAPAARTRAPSRGAPPKKHAPPAHPVKKPLVTHL